MLQSLCLGEGGTTNKVRAGCDAKCGWERASVGCPVVDVSYRRLADGLYLIDAGMYGEPERLACYYFDTPEPVLVECGPSVSRSHLVDALDELGVTDLAAVLVTHSHLDHAGGAGHFAARYPGAQVGVHAAGAKHLIDPSRLWASATRIYGEEGMQTLWGPMEPVAAERLLVLDEGDRVPLGRGRSIEVMYTPGHARHHVVFLEDDSGGCFVGDAVGIAFPHGHLVQPNSPPPDFDPHLIAVQLRRMARRDPRFLGFAHFGVHADPQQALGEAEERLWDWVRFVEDLPRDDLEGAAAALRDWVLGSYRADGHRDEMLAAYDSNTFWPMHVAGIQRWLAARET